MKILHTSDWHLGRTLHGLDLLPHQKTFHDFLVGTVADRGIDAVVIAGDVYDRAVPPVEAVRLLNDVLARLAEITTVIITPGNHDSAVRLGFGARLMRSGIHILSEANGIVHPVTVADDDGDVLFFGVPYLEPDMVRHALAAQVEEPLARSHEAVVAAAMDRVRAVLAEHDGARSVVLAHAFVTGGRPSESERDIRVGGVDQVPAGVFDGIDYVALGHLHGAQRIAHTAGVRGAVHYSGSPLAFSFSELHHTKGVLEVDLAADGTVTVEKLPTPVPHRLTHLTGTLDEVLARATGHGEDWVRVTITDARRPDHLQERLRAALPGLLLTEHAPDGPAATPATAVVTAVADPLEVADDFFSFVTGTDPSDDERAVFEAAYDRSRPQEESA